MKLFVRRFFTVMTLAVFAFGLPAPALWADVAPGDVIDKTNYQKIEGLVPDFILKWVKEGELIMKIGKLDFDPTNKFFPKEALDNWEANIGRYKIDEHNGIIDVKTGKPARGIKGLPFTVIDPKDPAMPVKIMWNSQFSEFFLQGHTEETQHWLNITRRGLEKTIVLDNLTTIFNPEESNIDFAQLTVFRKPFNLSGVGTLALYPLYPLENGIRYAYTPELRRMKRLSHRVAGSEARFGTDFSPDDSWAGGPKTNIEEGVYRYIGEKEALVPYFSESSRKIEKNADGELEMGAAKSGMKIRVGFEEPSWTGAPWHFMDIIWVKSKVWVIESKSTNPSYLYGPCEGWIEQGSLLHCYKRITDTGGNLWKGMYWPGDAIESTDGEFKVVRKSPCVEVDMKRDHATAVCAAFRDGAYRKILAKSKATLFTKAGFAKFSK